jgi:hypothetical protein
MLSFSRGVRSIVSATSLNVGVFTSEGCSTLSSVSIADDCFAFLLANSFAFISLRLSFGSVGGGGGGGGDGWELLTGGRGGAVGSRC